ncbi:MAG: sigma 54-interacting transcriptional regulator, partial [Bacillota bacterium]|nr:sigma 54-interacting transcriptional regulator [Bacillota bacterium]
AEGYVYKNVIETGEQQIIINPGEHPLCKRCLKKGNCEEKLELSSPIILGKEVIGVIGLICSNDKKKNTLIKKMDCHLEFLNQISEFIAAKVNEYLEDERNKTIINNLEQIIDSVDTGIIMTSEEDSIVHINNTAIKQLKLFNKSQYKSIDIKSKNEYIMGEEEFNVKIGSRSFDLLGHLIDLNTSPSSHNKVFIFNQIKKIRDYCNLTSSNNSITTEDILGKSKIMKSLKDKIKKIGNSNSTVLITGESGTGKELIARAIHSESDRYDKPFIPINCSAIPESLLESELFGYVKGAFSGANSSGRMGKFELANKGVIFLDEIGDMPLHFQVKILRVLQERKLVRIGSNQQINLDIRIIAATNRDLKELIKENKFREDLYYRLNVIPLNVPPLRERKSDISIIAEEMMEKYNVLFNKNVRGMDDDVKEILLNYSWPGNVRELENTLEYMINIDEGNGILTKDMLPLNLLEEKEEIFNKVTVNSIKPLKEIEKDFINRAVELYGNDTSGKKLASEKLGIGIATLYRKLKEC